MKRSLNKLVVYLADDHTLFRKGLIRLLSTFACVGEVKEASNGRELLKLVAEQIPDVVLVDLHMPVMDGAEVCRVMENKYPDVKVIILTMEDSEDYIQHLVSLGAHAYLSKSSPPEEVERAIYFVTEHDFYHNALVTQALRNFTRQVNKTRKDTPQFTDREVVIIKLICEEYTMKEIAERLNISDKTVQNHRAAIMDKMNAKNTAGLVKFAFLKGLIQVTEK